MCFSVVDMNLMLNQVIRGCFVADDSHTGCSDNTDPIREFLGDVLAGEDATVNIKHGVMCYCQAQNACNTQHMYSPNDNKPTYQIQNNPTKQDGHQIQQENSDHGNNNHHNTDFTSDSVNSGEITSLSDATLSYMLCLFSLLWSHIDCVSWTFS